MVIEGGRIQAVLPANTVDVACCPVGSSRKLLAPGFIDVQVNGGGGVQFNDVTTPEGIAAIGAAHRRFGTTGFMVTLISDTRAKTAEAVAAARAGLAAAVPGLLGIHIEGPFLNVERRGVHAAAMIRPLEPKDLAILTSLGAGRTLGVTLAPEKIVARGTSAASWRPGSSSPAGHTAIGLRDGPPGPRAGAHTGFTHLLSPTPCRRWQPRPRSPGRWVRRCWAGPAGCGLIVDLHHVSAASLQIMPSPPRGPST